MSAPAGSKSGAVSQPRLAADFAHFDLSSAARPNRRPKRPKQKAPPDDAADDAPLDANVSQLLQAPLASVRVDVLKSQCLMLEGKERRKVRAHLLVAMGARTAKRRPVGYAQLQVDRAEAKVRERADKVAERARLRVAAGAGAGGGRGPAQRKRAKRTVAGRGRVERIRHVNAAPDKGQRRRQQGRRGR